MCEVVGCGVVVMAVAVVGKVMAVVCVHVVVTLVL